MIKASKFDQGATASMVLSNAFDCLLGISASPSPSTSQVYAGIAPPRVLSRRLLITEVPQKKVSLPNASRMYSPPSGCKQTFAGEESLCQF